MQPVSLCAFFLVLSLSVLMSCSSESKAKQAVQRGEQLLAEGKRDEAIINFKKAIQTKSDSGEANFGLGRALFLAGQPSEAFAVLIRAAELLPNRVDVQAELGDTALFLYLATPSRPAALRDRLIKTSEKLSTLSPGSPDSYRFRAYIQLLDQHTQEAIQTARQGLGANPDDKRLPMVLIKALLLNGQVAEAEQLSLKSIARMPGQLAFYDLMIDYYSRSPETSANTERFLRLRVDNNPFASDALLSLARFYRNKNDASAVVAVIKPLLTDAQHFPFGPLQVADLHIEAEAYGPAEEVLREAIAHRPALRDAAQIRLAKLLLLFGRPNEAFSVTDQIAKERPRDKQVTLLRADLIQLARRTEQYELAATDLRAMLAQAPNDPELHTALGRILLGQRDLDGATREFEQTVKTDSADTNARLGLITVYLQKRQYARAIEIVDELLARSPGNSQYRLLHAMCLRGQNNLTEARTELKALNREFPNRGDILLEVASLSLAEGRASEAEPVFRQLLQSGRPNFQAVEGLVRSLVAQKQLDRGMEVLLAARKTLSDPNLDLLTAEVSFGARRFDQAVQFFSEADRNVKLSAAELAQYAQALQSVNELERAIAVARRAHELDPTQMKVHLFYAYLLQITGRVDPAIVEYRSVLNAHPSTLQAANNLAYLLAEKDTDLPEAMQLAKRCVSAKPDDDAFQDTLGWVTFKHKEIDKAVDIFQRIITKHPTQPIYRYHLAVALLAKGDRMQARKHLGVASQLGQDDHERQKLLDLLRSLQ